MIRLVLVCLVGFAVQPAHAFRCTEQWSFLQSIAARYDPPGYYSDLQPLKSGDLQRSYIVLGELDASYQFQGVAIDPGSADLPATFQISPEPQRLFYMMGRTPPGILGMPGIGQRFLGIVIPHRPGLAHPDDTGKHYVMNDECREGWVADPSPDYVERIRLCLRTGECD